MLHQRYRSDLSKEVIDELNRKSNEEDKLNFYLLLEGARPAYLRQSCTPINDRSVIPSFIRHIELNRGEEPGGEVLYYNPDMVNDEDIRFLVDYDHNIHNDPEKLATVLGRVLGYEYPSSIKPGCHYCYYNVDDINIYVEAVPSTFDIECINKKKESYDIALQKHLENISASDLVTLLIE